MVKRLFISLIFVYMVSSMNAQHQDLQEKPKIWNTEQKSTTDSISLLAAFKNGHVNGHFRYFFSTTDNAENLTDYYAHAAGGGLRFETASLYGFQFAVSGFYIFNLGSSDFIRKDPSSGQPNRYEIGLFDVENPENRKEISRLEEFYLRYNFAGSNIIFGKQLINTPFINLQDGRMRPTQVQGLWIDVKANAKSNFQAGWFYNLAPRGTSEWSSVEETYGIYPTGINPDGSKSGYKNNISSKGIGLLGMQYQILKNLKFQFWEFYADNVMNSILMQADGAIQASNDLNVTYGAQFIRQDKINNGGNIKPEFRYYTNEGKAITYGTSLGLQYQVWETSINYNRITSHGRYLMPREWGRDPFYTFIPRERNEGFGDVHATMIKVNWRKPNKLLNISFAAGKVILPDVKDFALNKYGMPSYIQFNLDVRYKFTGFFNGLESQLLVVKKMANGETYGEAKYILNKVDMNLVNLVLNYRF